MIGLEVSNVGVNAMSHCEVTFNEKDSSSLLFALARRRMRPQMNRGESTR